MVSSLALPHGAVVCGEEADGGFAADEAGEHRAARHDIEKHVAGAVDLGELFRTSGASSCGDIHVNTSLTFEQLARAWFAHHLAGWSATHAVDVIGSLERDVFPALGAMVPGEIKPPMLLASLRAVEQRGCIATARRLRQRLSMIFGYGVAEGKVESDPAALLGRAMRSQGVVRPQPALETIAECRALLAECDHIAGAGNMIALAGRFLALTAVRLDAVRGARWQEFEGLDGPEPLWRVPAARMKLKKAKKGEAQFDHLVPLSAEAVAVLRQAGLHFAMSNEGDLVFPRSGKNLPLGEGAIRALITRTSFAGRHVPHGWRASFSTVMKEALGDTWTGDIERALAHAEKDKVKAAYDRSTQLARRRAVFDRWGAMLTA